MSFLGYLFTKYTLIFPSELSEEITISLFSNNHTFCVGWQIFNFSYGIGYSKFIEESCFTPYAFGILSIPQDSSALSVLFNHFLPKNKNVPHGTHHICERCRESYCYYLMLFSRKKQLFISYFFYTAQKPLFKIISHSEKGFLVFNHIVALNVAPRSINTVETPYFRHFTLSATSSLGPFLWFFHTRPSWC